MVPHERYLTNQFYHWKYPMKPYPLSRICICTAQIVFHIIMSLLLVRVNGANDQKNKIHHSERVTPFYFFLLVM